LSGSSRLAIAAQYLGFSYRACVAHLHRKLAEVSSRIVSLKDVIGDCAELAFDRVDVAHDSTPNTMGAKVVAIPVSTPARRTSIKTCS
jgi:hypothetical protein